MAYLQIPSVLHIALRRQVERYGSEIVAEQAGLNESTIRRFSYPQSPTVSIEDTALDKMVTKLYLDPLLLDTPEVTPQRRSSHE